MRGSLPAIHSKYYSTCTCAQCAVARHCACGHKKARVILLVVLLYQYYIVYCTVLYRSILYKLTVQYVYTYFSTVLYCKLYCTLYSVQYSTVNQVMFSAHCIAVTSINRVDQCRDDTMITRDARFGRRYAESLTHTHSHTHHNFPIGCWAISTRMAASTEILQVVLNC